jgi:uncharacterized membrane protein YphA (DoxX/SURF4 family)
MSGIQRLERQLERSRRAALAMLWILLVVQVVWTIYDYMTARPPVADLLYPLVFVPAAALLAITRGRIAWVATIPRLLIGFSFVYNVADRLGALGPPGAPNVSWGDFQHFVAYTAQVNAFAPHALIPGLAVMATIGEGTLGIAMLLGILTRFACAGSTALLTVFGTAMVASGLSQFQYNVYLMAAAAWFLATRDAGPLSIDALVTRYRRSAASARQSQIA